MVFTDRHESNRLRLHHSEPVLQLDDYERLATSSPLPRFYRLQSLPMHEDTIQFPKKLPQLYGSNSSVKLLDSCGVVKVPAKRKLSLSNLFAKSNVKGKVTRPRDPPSSNTLLVPGNDETSKGSPQTRIRSRSLICEMSPIQETHGDSVTESQENSPINKILVPTIVQPTDVISLPIELEHNLLVPAEHFLSVLEPQESSSFRFPNAQDETCSSGSERSLNPFALQAKSKIGHSFEQSLSSLLIDDSEEMSSNVVLNATTYPPLPEMQPIFPYQTRSPRCTAISPVDVIKPLVSSTITAPVVVHGTTPSRPTPCARRSSESEINTTPKGSA